ncbi:hypothetical protein KR009_008045 [Drosophila setifemur]|nr:hypothetical protein KR009_008045 [Drosophila setifemur]
MKVTIASVRVLLLILAIVHSWNMGSGRSKSRFTNIQCQSYNDTYCVFTKCKLNLIGRGRIAANMYLKLLKVPIDNVWINWGIYRRYNGYHPFMYNISTDFCEMMKDSNRLSFAGLIIGAIKTRSNLNHTCPYDHDIILDNLEYTDDFLKSLPLPQGEYKIQLRFATYKVWRVQVNVFFVKDDL